MSGCRSTPDWMQYVCYQGFFLPETQNFPAPRGSPLHGAQTPINITVPEVRGFLPVYTLFNIYIYYIYIFFCALSTYREA